MKEEVRRIMKLVQEGKLSPDDAADLIDAFASSEHGEDADEGSHPPPPPSSDTTHSDEGGVGKEPFKSFVDAMEKLGKDIREIDWSDVAKQIRDKTEKGVEGIRVGIGKIRDGKWGWGGHVRRSVDLPLSLPEGKTLRIENASGDIHVSRTGALGSVHADAKFKGHDDLDAESKADQYTLIIEESENTVLLRQPDVSGLSVDLHINLPDAVPISIHTDSGDVDVKDMGATKITCRSGDVKLTGINGPIEMSLHDGDLTIEDCDCPQIQVESKSGDLVFRRVKGNLSVRTANGDISVIDASARTVSLETVSGDISLYLSEPVSGTVNIRTVNGDSSVHVPSTSDCRVTLSTLRGDVSCGAQLTDEARAEQRITGKMGDGAGVLDVSAVNGDVSLGVRETAGV